MIDPRATTRTLASRHRLASMAGFLALVALAIGVTPCRVVADGIGAPAPMSAASAAVWLGLASPGYGSAARHESVAGRFLTSHGVTTLLGFGAAAAATRQFDDGERMSRYLDDSPLGGLMDPGDMFGDARVLGGGACGLLLAGKLTGSRLLSDAGSDLSHALLLSAGTVWALKLAVDAERPSGGKHSFPSGHTAAAFSAAPVLAHHFGPGVGFAAYLLAASTGMARMEDRHHYFADVLFGAGIGLVTGQEVLAGSRFGTLLHHLSLSPRAAGFVYRY